MPNPLLEATDLPLDDKKRLKCHADLRVVGVEDAWAAGDSAAVPDLTKDDPNAVCGPTAQHAVRQAKQLGDNIVAVAARESRSRTTSTPTPARWRASACTAASPRSTASS